VRGYVCVHHTHSSHTHASARTPLPTCSSIKDSQAAAENVRTFGLMTSQRGPGRSQSSGNSGGGSTVYACPKCKRKFKDRQGLAYHYDNKRTFIRKGRTYTATFDGLHCVDDKQTQPYQSKVKDLVVAAHAKVAKVGMFAFGKTSTPGSTSRLIVPIAGSAPLPPALLPPPTPVDNTTSSYDILS
jgi:hypothetical protein